MRSKAPQVRKNFIHPRSRAAPVPQAVSAGSAQARVTFRADRPRGGQARAIAARRCGHDLGAARQRRHMQR
ncbi:hypothetical protein E1H18_2790 [Caulobacter sp. RHG1]|nr:hypothetical protein [Caulobacter sp. RHG1]